jgi:hypothetical protein
MLLKNVFAVCGNPVSQHVAMRFAAVGHCWDQLVRSTSRLNYSVLY